jgi:hypothetical protein
MYFLIDGKHGCSLISCLEVKIFSFLYPLIYFPMSNLECNISVGGKNWSVSLTCTGAKTAQNLFLTHYFLYILYELWNLIHGFRL